MMQGSKKTQIKQNKHKFCRNRGKINFVETEGYALCIIGLGGWMPLLSSTLSHCLLLSILLAPSHLLPHLHLLPLSRLFPLSPPEQNPPSTLFILSEYGYQKDHREYLWSF